MKILLFFIPRRRVSSVCAKPKLKLVQAERKCKPNYQNGISVDTPPMGKGLSVGGGGTGGIPMYS